MKCLEDVEDQAVILGVDLIVKQCTLNGGRAGATPRFPVVVYKFKLGNTTAAAGSTTTHEEEVLYSFTM